MQTDSNTNTMGWYVVLVASVAALAGILFGYDTGVISGAILFVAPTFHLTALQSGFAVSSVLFGALVGSFFSGRMADSLGRKKILIITALFFLLGTLLSAFAASTQMLIVGRLIVGFAIGVASFVAPLYISEIAPSKYRGLLVSLNQLAITVGILISYLIDAYFAKTENWRWMFGLGAVPAAILFLGMWVLPRSPRWMVLKGLNEEARKVLSKLRHGQNVDQELSEIENSIEKQQSNWRTLFQSWLAPALLVAFGLAFFQQITGINTIIYYAPQIFQYAGFSTAKGAISVTWIIGIVNVVFTIIALPLIDLWGRRPLLLSGSVGMGLSLAILGFSFSQPAFVPLLRWVALGSMILFIIAFAMSLGPMMWLVISEIFPLEVRGFAASLAVSACWASNMLVALFFPWMLHTLGTVFTFYTFTAFCLLAWFFVYLFVPETKGVALEQIEINLRKGLSSRQLGQCHSS